MGHFGSKIWVYIGVCWAITECIWGHRSRCIFGLKSYIGSERVLWQYGVLSGLITWQNCSTGRMGSETWRQLCRRIEIDLWNVSLSIQSLRTNRTPWNLDFESTENGPYNILQRCWLEGKGWDKITLKIFWICWNIWNILKGYLKYIDIFWNILREGRG